MTECTPFTEPRPLELERTDNYSVTQIVLNGVNKWAINHGSDTSYEVVCQTGTIIVGADIYELSPGKRVQVSKGTAYQCYGDNMRMIATCQPPFDPQTVEYLD